MKDLINFMLIALMFSGCVFLWTIKDYNRYQYLIDKENDYHGFKNIIDTYTGDRVRK